MEWRANRKPREGHRGRRRWVQNRSIALSNETSYRYGTDLGASGASCPNRVIQERSAVPSSLIRYFAGVDEQTEISWFITTFKHAEENAAAHMRGFGVEDARVTPGGPDSGIDVTASEALAQVKRERDPVSRPAVQQLFGARALNQRLALFFSFSRYSGHAMEYADQVGTELYVYDPDGSIAPVSMAAQQRLKSEELPLPAPRSLLTPEPLRLIEEDWSDQMAMAARREACLKFKARSERVTRAEYVALCIGRGSEELVERYERQMGYFPLMKSGIRRLGESRVNPKVLRE
jgi:hypothetical protein